VHAFKIFTLNTQGRAFMGTDPQEKGLETIIPELCNGDVFTDLDTGFKLNPKGPYHLDLAFDDISWKPVGGYPHGQHTAQNRQFFKNGNLVAFDGQKICTGQTRGSGADDPDFFGAFGFSLRNKRFVV